MMKKLINFTLLIALIFNTPAYALTKLFYALRDDDVPNLGDHYRVLEDIDRHHDKMDILVPQAYVLDSEGDLFMHMQPELAKKIKQYKIPLMPLVTIDDFNAEKISLFLKNKAAQAHAIHSLTKLCKTKHYEGFQIDFEHIPKVHRDAFTEFYTNTAKALHAIHCKISIAIIPQRHEIPPSKLLLRRDLNWSGAYDQKQLGDVSDFVVLMTYGQNAGETTPGPNASIPIDKEALAFALKHIPPKKIFLGIPTSSTYWSMRSTPSNHILAQGIIIPYSQVKQLQRLHHLKWQWDDYAKTHYAVFHFQDFYRYLFVSDARSINEKQKLAQQYHLGGIAIFRLGNEDPQMWSILIA